VLRLRRPYMRRRYLFCGGRDWSDPGRVRTVLNGLPRDAVIVHGAARGADETVDIVARHMINHGKDKRFWIISCPADWDECGKGGGPIRNRQMLDEFQPHEVIAFPGGNGTRNMVEQASLRGIPVTEISDE
jgi:hypothetical protein